MMQKNYKRVMAQGAARPPMMAVPCQQKVSAFTPGKVLDRWNDEAAGIRALSTGDATITMFDVIGEDFWSGGGITAKSVAAQLRAIGDRPVEVQINSPGGDMFEGIAIFNVLREHPQEITVKVMGMAASAASIIVMAGDRVEISPTSFIMIHNCSVVAWGNRHDLAKVVDDMEAFDQGMVAAYVARTSQSATEIAAWMNKETYMNGPTAIERGFADALLSADQMTLSAQVRAEDQALNKIRAMELALVSSGMTRSQARARIKEVKGAPGAAATSVTPGADVLSDELSIHIQAALAKISQPR